MRRYQSLSLKWKILIPFTLLAVFWAASGTFLLTRTAFSQAESRIEVELQQQMRVAGSAFADVVAGQIELVRLAANTEGVSEAVDSGDISRLEELLVPLLANSRAEILVVLDAQGEEMVAFWRAGEDVEVTEANLGFEVTRAVREAEDATPSDKQVVLAESEEGSLFLALGGIRRESQFAGFVAVGTRAQTLAERLQSAGGEAVALYDAAGRRAGSSGDVANLGSKAVAGSESRRFSAAGKEVLVGSLVGRGRVVARIAVFDSSRTLAGEMRRTGLGLAAVGLLAVVGVVALGLVIARAITAPLERVAKTAESIAEGDLSQRAPVREGDEIGLLGRAFNTMAGRLQESYADLEKRVEERTRELQAANSELARMAQAKSEFLANMSHELRTPLNAIIGYSEVLFDPFFGPQKPAEVRKRARAINDSGTHLLNLINDLLDVSKIEAGKLELRLEEIPVKPTIQDLLRLIGPMAAAKGLRVRARLKYAPEVVRVDEKRFRQIVLNLLANAVKFTPDGGSVTVEAVEERNRLYLTVADNGIGIPSGQQDAIFEQFLQVDGTYARKQEGTGLGLTLTRQLVELHGGSIWVESEEGKGSRFTVELPVRKIRRASRKAS